MAKRLSLDDKLAAVRLLRDRDPSPELTAELKTAIDDRSNLIVAAAAAIAGDQGLLELVPTLASALDRFLVDPLKTDKLCRAKLAVIQALDKLEHRAPDVFLKAARHVQLEPVWGGSEDTAAPLRAAALLALARIDVDGLLTILVDALVDPQKDVRIAAAQALGYHGSESAGLILRLKARLGDREPEVFSECLSGLLACAEGELPAGLGIPRPGRHPCSRGSHPRPGAVAPARSFRGAQCFLESKATCRTAGDCSPCHGHAPPSRGDRIPGRAGRHRSRGRIARRPIRAQDPLARFTAPPADRGGDSAKEYARAACKV